MKKIILTISILVALSTSCVKDGADLIDPAVTSGGLNDAFGNYQKSDQFLLDIYRQVVAVLPRTDGVGSRWRGLSLLDVGDEHGSVSRSSVTNIRDWNSGAATASTALFSRDDWQEGYAAIRACLLYLDNEGNVPADVNYPAATRAVRRAEAKWLLAFNYAELLKDFGGVPLVKKVFNSPEGIDLPRASYQEVLDYIVQLCDEVAPILPPKHEDTQLGRATRGAALALKARMLLYAASPLNSADSQAKWIAAAQAEKAVMDLNLYSLHPDISTLFTTRTNDEIIYARMQEPIAYFTAISVPYLLYFPGAYAIGGENQVTYNLLKEYEVLKGGVAYSVNDPASGHNFQDPYKNRDPRFYRDFIYNGAKIRLANVTKTADLGEAAPGSGKSVADMHNPVGSQHITSYHTYVHLVKFADLKLNITADPRSPASNGRTNQNYPYFRYAEVLMNYAEAMNEAYGPEGTGSGLTMTALQAANLVRQRAKYPTNNTTTNVEYMGYTAGTGMPAFPNGLTKDQFRLLLRHERKIEFAWEEHWFWDFRRWKLTPETNIQAQVPVWTSPTTVTYQIRTIENRYWNEKMYRMPIPEAEIQTSPSLRGNQNPGW